MILFVVFNLGFPRKHWHVLEREVRAHGISSLGGPWDYLRGYFTRYEDEQLYFAYGVLATGDPAGGRALSEWAYRRPDLASQMPPRRPLMPYRDFAVEYPPLAVFAFAAAVLPSGGHFQRFKLAWSLLMELAVLATIVLALRARARLEPGSERRLAWYAAIALFLLGPIVTVRMDALPTLAVTGALALAQSGRRRNAAALLGLGFATKVFPAVMMPVLLASEVGARRFRRAAESLGMFLACALLPFVPFLVLAPGGTGAMFAYHVERGLHVEAVLAMPSLLAAAAGLKASIAIAFGSWNIADKASRAILILSTMGSFALPVLVAGIVYGRARRDERPVDGATMTLSMGAALAGAMVFAKVLSFQYLVWLFPIVLLAGTGDRSRLGRRRADGIRVAFALAALIGQVLFPYCYRALLDLSPLPLALLCTRNVLLVVVGALLCQALGSPQATEITVSDPAWQRLAIERQAEAAPEASSSP